ncbi:SDR family oxidoreductase [Cohnella yongneupensis]|uniref:SDR family oxidoreductase n=1 Tax=Cohnella yongneupensis TaxID=425006 RepID=A0ABW0QZC3_9BACL
MNRVAVVVGGSEGIGRATVLHMAEKGYRVVVSSRSEHKLEAVKEELAARGLQAITAAGDITDAAFRLRLFEQIDNKYGRLDILVNSVPGADPASFLQHDIQDVEAGIRMKLIPYLDNMKLASARMRTNGWGRIVNVVGNMWKEPESLRYNFGIVNAAIVNASKAVSFELAPLGITVNGVHPGSIRSERLDSVFRATAEKLQLTKEQVEQKAASAIPAGRIGEPEEAAALIGFLVSEEASFVTGQQISVDGGAMRSM